MRQLALTAVLLGACAGLHDWSLKGEQKDDMMEETPDLRRRPDAPADASVASDGGDLGQGDASAPQDLTATDGGTPDFLLNQPDLTARAEIGTPALDLSSEAVDMSVPDSSDGDGAVSADDLGRDGGKEADGNLAPDQLVEPDLLEIPDLMSLPEDLMPSETCADGIRNQDETDADCGGATCPKCWLNLACLQASDCLSNLCSGTVCKGDVGQSCALPSDCELGGCASDGTKKLCVPGNTVFYRVDTKGDATVLRCNAANGSGTVDWSFTVGAWMRLDGMRDCFFIKDPFTYASGVTGLVSWSDGTSGPICTSFKNTPGLAGFWTTRPRDCSI